MKKETEMRSEYDFSKGERGKFYGRIAGVRIVEGKRIKKRGDGETDEDLEEINLLFHRLWSKAQGQEGYKKSEWTKLGKLLNKNNIPV